LFFLDRIPLLNRKSSGWRAVAFDRKPADTL